MRQLDSRSERGEPLFQTSIAVRGVVLLSRLVILTAEDDDVEVPVRLDAQVVVLNTRIPPQCVGYRAARQTPGDDIAGVEGELGLEERGAGQPGEADQRVVRRDDDVLTAHDMAGRLHRARLAAEFISGRVFVDAASQLDERPGHARQVAAGLNACLIRKTNAWTIDEWYRLDVFRVEPQIARERRIFPQTRSLSLPTRFVLGPCVQVPVDPSETGVDRMLTDDVVNHRDRRQPGIPDRLGVVAPEPLDEFGQPRIGHHRQVGAGMAGVGRRAAIALEHDHPFAGLRQQVRRAEAGDARSYDDHIGLGVLREPGKPGERCRCLPIRGGVVVVGRHEPRP